MAGPADIFRELHQLHQTAHGLREQLDRFPYQLKAQKTKVTRREQVLHEAQASLKQLKVQTHQREVTLKGKHEQIRKYQKQRDENVTNKREFDAFQAEINNAEIECRRLEEEILTAMSEAEERTASLPEMEKNLETARQESIKFEESGKERMAGVSKALAEVQQKLKEVESRIPEDLWTVYNRVVQAKGADALTPVRNRACGACATELTAQNYQDVLVGAFFICRSCERILYLPADHT
jgi:uncharacterized protein